MEISFNGLLFYFILCLTSCSKGNANNEQIQDFPDAIGNSWTYNVFDSIKHISDTEFVKIIGTTTLNNGMNSKIIRTINYFSADTTFTYLETSGNRAIFYLNKDAKDYNKVYQFPLKENTYWFGENLLDTNKVISKENIIVPAGSFIAYKIHRSYTVTNVGINETEWYTPKIGMIKRDYYERNIGFTIKKTYELVYYKIHD